MKENVILGRFANQLEKIKEVGKWVKMYTPSTPKIKYVLKLFC